MMHPNTRNNTAHLKRCALVFAGLADQGENCNQYLNCNQDQ